MKTFEQAQEEQQKNVENLIRVAGTYNTEKLEELIDDGEYTQENIITALKAAIKCGCTSSVSLLQNTGIDISESNDIFEFAVTDGNKDIVIELVENWGKDKSKAEIIFFLVGNFLTLLARANNSEK
jgi:hypothetical protein